MRISRKSVCILLVFLASASLTACAQTASKDVSNSDELDIKFRFPATEGTTTKYLIDFTAIPNVPPFSSIYSPVPNRTYEISTTTVDLGDPVLTFRVPSNTEAEFGKVRILRLIQDDLAPSGYRWRDCTISTEPPAERFSPELLKQNPDFYPRYLEQVKLLLPNFPARTVTCKDELNRWLSKEYVAVVMQNSGPPERPFTDIRLRLDPPGGTGSSGETTYKLIIENTGNKDAFEINLWSRFGTDLSVLSIVPSQGSCRERGRGVSGEVCHLGKLPSKGIITIDVRGRPSGTRNGGVAPTGTPNKFWSIEGFAKENAGDPNWLVNRFEFEPLKPKSVPKEKF